MRGLESSVVLPGLDTKKDQKSPCFESNNNKRQTTTNNDTAALHGPADVVAGAGVDVRSTVIGPLILED